LAFDWKKSAQALIYQWINPLINVLVKSGIKPNHVTFAGLILNFVAAGLFIYGAEYGERFEHNYVGWASAVILFAGFMDMIDGRLARVGNMDSKYGALYDSVLDRYSEMIMFLGICYYLIYYQYFLSSIFAFIAMTGSIMVSYTRARAEGLGVKMADVGLMQRPERILLIGISGILCSIMSDILGSDFKITVSWLPFPVFETITFFTFPIFILSLLANITAINRLYHARELLDSQNE
jgi:CDP-diacylglycerol--glycerol-3-phosphate 3-phosphatidyltransferase